MTMIQGYAWPDNVGGQWAHALKHVQASLEISLMRCIAHSRTRTAVQAGGNVGLWPRRLAAVFSRVITFEPDAITRECLLVNVPPTVTVRPEALGEAIGWCGLSRKNLGSHKVTDGSTVPVMTVDALELDDLDLLQLDVEGYEWPALKGAADTLRRCRPVIHLELRDEIRHRRGTTAEVVSWLRAQGYHQTATAPGGDAIFEAGR